MLAELPGVYNVLQLKSGRVVASDSVAQTGQLSIRDVSKLLSITKYPVTIPDTSNSRCRPLFTKTTLFLVLLRMI